MFEEISTLYEDASSVRNPTSEVAAAAQVAAPTSEIAAEEEARRKEERRLKHAAQLAEKLASCGRRVSRARIAVEEKIAELRADEEARIDFDKYCQGIRVVPNLHIVERNIAALGGGPEQWHRSQVEQAKERRARRARLREQQMAQYEVSVRQSQAHLEAEIARRSSQRRLGLRRAQAERLQVGCARWLVLSTLASSAGAMRSTVLEGRRKKAEHDEQEEAARTFQKLWRSFLITVRLRKLLRCRKLLRRGVFWWRMRRRIEAKRFTVGLLVSWLRSLAETAACPVGRRIKLFLCRVTMVQRAWRRASRVYHAQLQVVLISWGASDFRRVHALRKSSSPPRESDDTALSLSQETIARVRCSVAAEDLTRRRREHAARLAEWARKVDERRKVAELDAMILAARELLSHKVVILQSRARGRIIRQASQAALETLAVPARESSPKSSTAQRERSSSGSSSSVVAVRRPVFKLVPHEDDMAKLNAKLKAKQRAILFGGQSSSNLINISTENPLLSFSIVSFS